MNKLEAKLRKLQGSLRGCAKMIAMNTGRKRKLTEDLPDTPDDNQTTSTNMSPRRSVRIRRMPVRYGSTMQPPATSNGQRNTRGQGPKPKGRAATRNKSPDNSPRMYSSGQVDRASGSVLPVAHDNRTLDRDSAQNQIDAPQVMTAPVAPTANKIVVFGTTPNGKTMVDSGYFENSVFSNNLFISRSK